MTDEHRAELRSGIEAVVRAASSVGDDADAVHATNSPTMRREVVVGQVVGVRVRTQTVDADTIPPLTTAQQLALSVLLGEPVPLADLVAACEDAGVYPAGVLDEVRRLAYEQGKADASPFAGIAKSMTPAMLAYAESCRNAVSAIAAGLAVPPALITPSGPPPP